jgi:hypothetical protein
MLWISRPIFQCICWNEWGFVAYILNIQMCERIRNDVKPLVWLFYENGDKCCVLMLHTCDKMLHTRTMAVFTFFLWCWGRRSSSKGGAPNLEKKYIKFWRKLTCTLF